MQENNRVYRTLRRGDIQGLRAIAVLLVVGYHYFPAVAPGGFIGVDVFFVISGFLITLLLVRELDITGRISMREFYARRIRRLLPASLTVTIVTAAIACFLLGPLQLARVFEDAAWATAYLANFDLAKDPGGYFAATHPSLFTHFWSLAVEEQFYLLWPVVLGGTALLFRKRWRAGTSIVLALILLSSLAASIVLTAESSSAAYYSLGTRAWELAVGGAVAFGVAFVKRTPDAVITGVAGAFGLLMIFGAAIRFDDLTPFPSWTAAIPAVGTAFVIWAGSHRAGGLARGLGVAPLRFVGDISYSLYLWHWPVLVLGTGVLGAGNIEKAGLLALAFALAIASYFGIERGVGRWKSTLPAGRIIAIGAGATATLIVGLVVAAASLPTTGGPAVATARSYEFRAGVHGSTIEIESPLGLSSPEWLPANVEPTLEGLPADLADVFLGCMGIDASTCEGGDPDGATTIVLAGDSQAGQWWPAADEAARENGWKLYGVAKSGCPLAMVAMTDEQETVESPGCREWRGGAVDRIAALKPDLILFANRGYGYGFDDGDELSEAAIADWGVGLPQILNEIVRLSPVVYFGRSPVAVDVGECLYENLRDVSACETPRDVALPPVARLGDAAAAAEAGAIYFDPSSLVCSSTCPVVDRNRIMYRDKGHLNASYSALLSPAIAAVVKAALLPQ